MSLHVLWYCLKATWPSWYLATGIKCVLFVFNQLKVCFTILNRDLFHNIQYLSIAISGPTIFWETKRLQWTFPFLHRLLLRLLISPRFYRLKSISLVKYMFTTEHEHCLTLYAIFPINKWNSWNLKCLALSDSFDTLGYTKQLL